MSESNVYDAWWFLVLVLGVVGFLLFINLEDTSSSPATHRTKETLNNEDYVDYDSDNSDEMLNDSLSNVSEIHFSKSILTYSFTSYKLKYNGLNVPEVGREDKKNDIRDAFMIIQNSTQGILNFTELSEDEPSADIKVYLINPTQIKEIFEDNEDGELYTVGLGSIDEYVDNVILSSSIYFIPHEVTYYGQYSTSLEYNWYINTCQNFPRVEIHEILHSLGFGHDLRLNDKIMFPFNIRVCDIISMDIEVSDCLKEIYSNRSQASNCSKLNLFPYDDEKLSINRVWGSLPIYYNINNCSKRESDRLRYTAGEINNAFNKTIFVNSDKVFNLIISCLNDSHEIELSQETDYWDLYEKPAIHISYELDEDNKIFYTRAYLLNWDVCVDTLLNNNEYESALFYRAIGYRSNLEYKSGHLSSACDPFFMPPAIIDFINESYSL